MNDVINLGRARKAKARIAAEHAGARNRAIFGRTRVEKERLEAERKGAEQRLDGHRLKPVREE